MATIQGRQEVIGLLYPGEMGAALGKLLRDAGFRVVTTLPGRGPKTRQRCRDLGLEELDTLREVAATATVILSLVPPAAAVQVARQLGEQLTFRPVAAGRLTFVDLNSIAPATAGGIAEIFAGTPVDFVDGGISGPASHLASRCVMYLSGGRAEQVAALFEGKMQIRVLGDKPGQASTLRMLLSGLAKGVVALFVEMALAARKADVLDQLTAACQGSYPGVMEVVERSLPTFPSHAVRRGQEMAEVEATLADLGLCPTVAAGIRKLITDMGQLWPAGAPERAWSIAEVINELHERQLLRLQPDLVEEPSNGR